MFFKFILFWNILLASVALALAAAQLGARFAPQFKDHHPESHSVNSAMLSARDIHTTTQAGAVFTRSDSSGSLTTVKGIFTVPTLLGGDGAFDASIGIDGFSCSGTLRVGIQGNITSGVALYDVWFPFSYNGQSVSPFAIEPGDVITLSIMATSFFDGSVIIENLTTGQMSSMMAYPQPDTPLCLRNASWIIATHGDLALANFGSVHFTGATASGLPNGLIGGPDTNPSDQDYNPASDNVQVLDIVQSNQIFTLTTTAKNSVLVQYF